MSYDPKCHLLVGVRVCQKRSTETVIQYDVNTGQPYQVQKNVTTYTVGGVPFPWTEWCEEETINQQSIDGLILLESARTLVLGIAINEVDCYSSFATVSFDRSKEVADQLKRDLGKALGNSSPIDLNPEIFLIFDGD